MTDNKQQASPEVRLCDRCDKPGMWHLRAKQLFLCDEHRRKLEWEQGDTK